MADNKKYFLDLTGLRALWSKMKNAFASKEEVETIKVHISTLQADIDGVEALTLSYAPKIADNYSAAVELAKTNPAGTVIVVKANQTIDDVVYNKGFYIIDGDKAPHYIGTSTGTSSSIEIADLRERISALEKDIIKTASIVDANGNSLSAFTIANNNLVLVYDDEVIANSDSVNALTHRAIAAKFGELESMLSSVPKFKIEVVDALPVDSISFSTIYLVKENSEITNNIYTEYLYIQDSVKGNHWEVLGSQALALDNYVTKEFLTTTINTAIADYAKKSDVDAAVNAAKTEILNTIAVTYATKDEIMTEDSIIESISNGRIGNEIKITIEQIESLS